MKILSDKEYLRLYEADKIMGNVYTAKSRLAEFDDTLKPMWDYILHDSISIEDARNKMRKNYEKI